MPENLANSRNHFRSIIGRQPVGHRHCFIKLEKPILLAPGIQTTYNFEWYLGDFGADAFHIDWYDNANWQALELMPLPESEILPDVTFIPESPLERDANALQDGFIIFNVPIEIESGSLFGVLGLIKLPLIFE